jgi:hypothetical protein
VRARSGRAAARQRLGARPSEPLTRARDLVGRQPRADLAGGAAARRGPQSDGRARGRPDEGDRPEEGQDPDECPECLALPLGLGGGSRGSRAAQ